MKKYVKIDPWFLKKHFVFIKKKTICSNLIVIKRKIKEDKDFIWSKKYNFSLQKFLKRNNFNLNHKTISNYLKMSLTEFEELYKKILDKLRNNLTGLE